MNITQKAEAELELPTERPVSPRAYPILLADIGGTNARFSLVGAAGEAPLHFDDVQTSAFAGLTEAISDAVFVKTALRPASAIIAIASPVKGNEIPLTNCNWVIKPRELIAELGIDDVLILNDFEAQALACSCALAQDLAQIGPDIQPFDQTRLIIGPGTGLGVAGLARIGEIWAPLPGEGGHVDLGPRSDRDHEIFPHLRKIDGRISGEQILCGRGLVNLYEAICKADGVDVLLKSPEEISDAALTQRNMQAVEAVALFCVYLGRVAGDLALVYLAKGGVFLAGGISQKILSAIRTSDFRLAFEDKSPHAELMQSIPTLVLTHPRAALEGLFAFANEPQKYAVNEIARRWQR